MRQIILASGSPRRKELLELMGLTFTVIPSGFEEWLDDTKDTASVAIALGMGKAREVAGRYPDAIVIGGDTIVTVDGKQLGKAETQDEARDMLKGLAGKTHSVTTSAVVLCAAEEFEYAISDTTMVVFKPYDEIETERYIRSEGWRGMAGAYAVQGGAAPLIDHIEGDIETVIGLPTRLLIKPLACLDVITHPANYKL